MSGVSEENKKAETCWSEAEIPSEAKRQRGTLTSPCVLKPCQFRLGVGMLLANILEQLNVLHHLTSKARRVNHEH